MAFDIDDFSLTLLLSIIVPIHLFNMMTETLETKMTLNPDMPATDLDQYT